MNLRQILAVLLCMLMLAFPVYAAEADILESEGEEHTATVDGCGSADDRLMSLLYGGTAISPSATNRTEGRLSFYEAELYRRAKAMAAQVAAGTLCDTLAAIPIEETELYERRWSAADLGVTKVVEGNAITEEAAAAMRVQLEVDFSKVFRSVLADCPYELFWSRNSYSFAYFGLRAVWADGEYQLCYTGTLRIRFAVSEHYAADPAAQYCYETDPAKIGRVSGAMDTIHRILSAYSDWGDVEKLCAYRDEICALTSYDYSAVGGASGYGDPWQLVYVFDGDRSTNVVCEGYSKAFQYLCELTPFDSEISVYSVTGNLTWSTGQGGHMWNIVHFPDGRNLLADLTNYDSGSTKLFLAEAERGSLEEGYTIGTHTYVYDARAYAVFLPSELTLSVYSPPLVLLASPEDCIADEGQTAVFRVAADGTGIRYQWQYQTPTGVWANCSAVTQGYNTESIRVAAALSRNGYRYRCLIRDNAGNRVTSQEATLTVGLPLAILTHPEDRTEAVGQAAVFSVIAQGLRPEYRWQYCTPSGSWSNCSSATQGYQTDTIQVSVTQGRSGYRYRCQVRDAYGSVVLSEPALLTAVNPLSILAHPEDQAAAVGDNAVFSVTADGEGLSYRWQYCTPNGSWANCTAATLGYSTDTISVSVTQGRNGYRYRCTVRDTSGNTATSEAAALTVGYPPVITLQPEDCTAEAGSIAVFTAAAKGNGLQYRWQYKTPASDWANCSASTQGYNTEAISVSAANSRNGYQYRFTAKDSSGNIAVSEAATLTVSHSARIQQPEAEEASEALLPLDAQPLDAPEIPDEPETEFPDALDAEEIPTEPEEAQFPEAVPEGKEFLPE